MLTSEQMGWGAESGVARECLLFSLDYVLLKLERRSNHTETQKEY